MNSKGDKLEQIGLNSYKDLVKGEFYKTIWGWEGIISEIDKRFFRFGQGIRIIRVGDCAKFCIHPCDIVR